MLPALPFKHLAFHSVEGLRVLSVVRSLIHRNAANAISLLGLLPLCILFGEGGGKFLIPLLIYNNIMDDLDGVLAVKMNCKSDFGTILDNVCDAIAHTIFTMAVGLQLGGLCSTISLAAVGAIVLRVVSRLHPSALVGMGSPTNELMRHMLFVVLLARIYGFVTAPVLSAVFLLHSVSMLAPFPMPYLIRSLTKSATGICMVNISLVLAWLAPIATPVIASCFVVTYLSSLVVGGVRWWKERS